MQKNIISEMNSSVQMLQHSGEIPCDLDFCWVPEGEMEQEAAAVPAIMEEESALLADDQEGHEDDAVDGDYRRLKPSSALREVEEGPDSRHSRRESSSLGAKKRRREGARRQDALPVTPASFVFFLADDAPFIMGKVQDKTKMSLPEELRVLPSRERENMVPVHFFSPVALALRNNAAAANFEDYVRATFSADFLMVDPSSLSLSPSSSDGEASVRKASRVLRVEDIGWEDASQVVAVAKCLNNSGGKIPARVVHELRTARVSRLSAREGEGPYDDYSTDDEVSIMELTRKKAGDRGLE